MKRRLIIGSILGVLLLSLFSWALYFLLWTPGGVHWLLRNIPRYSPVTIEVGKVTGWIAGDLSLENLKARWPGGRLDIQSVQTSLKPWHLLRGHLLFQKMASGPISLEVKPLRPEPLDLTLPKITGLLGRFDLEVRNFRLDAFHYRSNSDRPLVIKNIAGRLAWKRGFLAIDPLELELDQGRLTGTLGLGLAVPSLLLDVHYYPEKPLPGADWIRIEARLNKGRGAEQLKGLLAASSRSGSKDRLRFQAVVSIASRYIDLAQISLQEIGRPGTVKGQGKIIFESSGATFRADLNLEALDLSRELKIPARFSGKLGFVGNPDQYEGHYALTNKASSWQAFQMGGTFHGHGSGLVLKLDRGDWLDGVFKGQTDLAWTDGFSLRCHLEGRQIRTEMVRAGWPGKLNADLKGDLIRLKSGQIRADLNLRLLESSFQGRPLKGEVLASWQDDRLSVTKADLHGRGVSLMAKGVLDDRLDFVTRVGDLSLLLPKSRGTGIAKGWIRWRNQKLGGQLSLQGRDFSLKTLTAGKVSLEAGFDQEKKDTALEVKTQIKKGSYNSFPVDSLVLQARGTLIRQEINLSFQGPEGKVEAGLEGAFNRPRWQGTLSSLSGELPRGSDFRLRAPVALNLSPDRLHVSSLVLTGPLGEILSLDADLTLKPLSGSLRVEWQGINLSRARPWLGKFRPEGQASGRILARFLREDRLNLMVGMNLKGQFQIGPQTVNLSRAGGSLTWDEAGLQSFWDLGTSEGGRIKGQASSSERGRMAFPSRGRFSSDLEGFNLATWKTLFPTGLMVGGRVSGQIQGQWGEGRPWSLGGGLKVLGGSLAWKNTEPELQVRLNRADLGVQWQESAMRGTLALEFEEYGQASGNFSLPLPAHFPIKIQPSGLFQANLSGKFQEKGLMTALFPQAVRASRGLAQWNLSANGTWEKPALGGTLELQEAGVDLPSLGLQLRNLSAKVLLQEDRIILNDLRVHSGPGYLNGRGLVRLKNWKIAGLEGKLTGQDFQMVNQPEVQALGSPDLVFSGTPDRVTIQGALKIPEAALLSGPETGLKKASPDVVLVDGSRSKPAARVFPIQGEVNLVFGEKVRLKAAGLQTGLRGNLTVRIKDSRDLKAYGEIQTVQGRFDFQGRKLDITRGRFVFKGPPDDPTLDLLALRTIKGRQGPEGWIDEVKAGVVVSGPLRSPIVKLYALPPQSETDILSYILFGEPLKKGADKQDLALLGKVGQALLGRKMENRLFRQLDLDTLEIQSDGGDVSRSIVTVGKYLDPRLYLGLGGSLFSNTYQIILRYTLTPRLELETKGGTQSGGGIYYKLDFQ